jgi:hypothetical protein
MSIDDLGNDICWNCQKVVTEAKRTVIGDFCPYCGADLDAPPDDYDNLFRDEFGEVYFDE